MPTIPPPPDGYNHPALTRAQRQRAVALTIVRGLFPETPPYESRRTAAWIVEGNPDE